MLTIFDVNSHCVGVQWCLTISHTCGGKVSVICNCMFCKYIYMAYMQIHLQSSNCCQEKWSNQITCNLRQYGFNPLQRCGLVGWLGQNESADMEQHPHETEAEIVVTPAWLRRKVWHLLEWTGRVLFPCFRQTLVHSAAFWWIGGNLFKSSMLVLSFLKSHWLFLEKTRQIIYKKKEKKEEGGGGKGTVFRWLMKLL